MPLRVNIHARVNSASIRQVVHNGRAHYVIPSYTLPTDVVMNDVLYPRAEVERTYQSLEGSLAPIGHPIINGQPVSARSPEGLNLCYGGAWNRNVQLTGNRVYLEKWLDVEVAGRTDAGKRLLERLDAIQRGEDVPAVHTSVAAYVEERPAPEGANYRSVAHIVEFDHDAILIDEPGAATPEQGVGLLVNSATARAPALVGNAGALASPTYGERMAAMQRAAEARFAVGDQYAWVADFNEGQVVIGVSGKDPALFSYATNDAGEIVIEGDGAPVERRESWARIARVAFNSLTKFFQPRAEPEKPEGGDMPITEQERADIVRDVSQAVGKTIGETIATNMQTALQPVTEQLNTLQANHAQLAEQMTAGARAEEATQRAAVAAVHGDIVANALQGEALTEMFRKCATPADLNTNNQKPGAQNTAPGEDYFGGAK